MGSAAKIMSSSAINAPTTAPSAPPEKSMFTNHLLKSSLYVFYYAQGPPRRLDEPPSGPRRRFLNQPGVETRPGPQLLHLDELVFGAGQGVTGGPIQC
ncbi:hypothetical protein ODE01S_18020 [Oceanithermus desulfurans NBRC 100063]|uniref:Uncharacterized protein n=1 Tax=Oceanithermus desulfurans NBRC 100063 TaxID=1227550 RepID=A0A511RL35_9DEIN|nr:hypothetical protein ODE01S_18020 [Oceanithermus desulfurans NBRC 100063]